MDNIHKGIWYTLSKNISVMEQVILVVVLVLILYLGYLMGKGIGNPLDRIPLSTGWRWVVLVILLALLGAFKSSMGSKTLDTPASPYKIVSYELAKTRENVSKIFLAWNESGKAKAQEEIKIDFAFILYYVITLGFIYFWLADVYKDKWIEPVALTLGWSIFIAGLLDVIENIALLRMLNKGMGEQLLAGIAFWTALPKSIIAMWIVVPFSIIAIIMLLWSSLVSK